MSSWKSGCPGNVTDESKKLFESIHEGEHAEMEFTWQSQDITPSVQAYYYGDEAKGMQFSGQKFEKWWYDYAALALVLVLI